MIKRIAYKSVSAILSLSMAWSASFAAPPTSRPASPLPEVDIQPPAPLSRHTSSLSIFSSLTVPPQSNSRAPSPVPSSSSYFSIPPEPSGKSLSEITHLATGDLGVPVEMTHSIPALEEALSRNLYLPLIAVGRASPVPGLSCQEPYFSPDELKDRLSRLKEVAAPAPAPQGYGSRSYPPLSPEEDALLIRMETQQLRSPFLSSSGTNTPIKPLPHIQSAPSSAPISPRREGATESIEQISLSPHSAAAAACDPLESLGISPFRIAAEIPSESLSPEYIKFILTNYFSHFSQEQRSAIEILLTNPCVLKEVREDFNNKKTERLAANTGDALCQHRALILLDLYKSGLSFEQLSDEVKIYLMIGHMLAQRNKSLCNEVGMEVKEKIDFKQIRYGHKGSPDYISFGNESFFHKKLNLTNKLEEQFIDEFRKLYARMTDGYVREITRRYYGGRVVMSPDLSQDREAPDKIIFDNLLATQPAMVTLLGHLQKNKGVIGLRLHHLQVGEHPDKGPGHTYNGEVLFFKYDEEKKSFEPYTPTSEDPYVVIFESYAVHNPRKAEEIHETLQSIREGQDIRILDQKQMGIWTALLESASSFSDYVKTLCSMSFHKLILMASSVVDLKKGLSYSPPLSSGPGSPSPKYVAVYNSFPALAKKERIRYKPCFLNKGCATLESVPFGLFHVLTVTREEALVLQQNMRAHSGKFLPLTQEHATSEAAAGAQEQKPSKAISSSDAQQKK